MRNDQETDIWPAALRVQITGVIPGSHGTVKSKTILTGLTLLPADAGHGVFCCEAGGLRRHKHTLASFISEGIWLQATIL